MRDEEKLRRLFDGVRPEEERGTRRLSRIHRVGLGAWRTPQVTPKSPRTKPAQGILTIVLGQPQSRPRRCANVIQSIGMGTQKKRLTVTVDPELVEAGKAVVDAGDASSVSSWVSAALEEKIYRDNKLRHLAAAIADFEEEFGEISEDEIARQRRLDRARAISIRSRPPDINLVS